MTARPARSRPLGWRLLLLLALFSLIAGACAGGDATNEASNTEGTGGGGQTGTTAAGTPKPGGKLVYGLESESAQGFFMPAATCAVSCLQISQSIYDPLTYADADGKIKPYLAESVTPSPDYKTWTIKARPGIKFHNGEPFNAAAIKQNLDAQKKGSVTALALIPYASSEVVDDSTVKVNMSIPWVAFDSVLAGQVGYQMAPAMINAPDNGKTKPIGTGPFVFKEWVVDSRFNATKNPSYWQQGLPYLDEVEFRPIPEVTARRSALESGDIQMMHTDNGEEVDRLRKNTSIEMQESTTFSEVRYVMFNTTAAPLDDPRVRRALALATDRAEFNKLRFKDISPVADGPFPEGSLGHLPETGFPEFNLDEAKALVQQVEAEKGPIRFTVGTTSDPANLASMQLVQQQWAKAGIEVNVTQTEQQKFIVDALQGKFQANYWRNHAGVDPDQQFYWWHSALAPAAPAIAINFGRIRDPEIDQSLVTVRTNPDPATRKTAAETINREFAKEVYNLWLGVTLWAIPHRPEVKNATGTALPGETGKSVPIFAGRHFLTSAYLDR